MEYDVTFDHEDGRHLAVTAFDARPEDLAEQFGPAFSKVAEHCARHGVPLGAPAVSCYETRGDTFHVCSGFVVDRPIDAGDGVETMQLPQVDTATTTHLGSYDALGDAYEALRTAAREQGREVDEDAMMWEEYWTGPDGPVEQWRTVVRWPLRPAAA